MLKERYKLSYTGILFEKRIYTRQKSLFLLIFTEYISISPFPNIQKNYPKTFNQCPSHVYVSNTSTTFSFFQKYFPCFCAKNT